MARKVYQFTVPGKLYAYRRVRDHGTYKNYSAYKARVLEEAARQTTWKETRVSSLETHPISLRVLVYWRKSRRIDTSNVLKGIEDALFDEDRFIDEIYCKAIPHTGEQERCEVTIEHEEEPVPIPVRRKRSRKTAEMGSAGREEE